MPRTANAAELAAPRAAGGYRYERYEVEAHPGHPRLCRIGLEVGALQEFLDQTRAIDVQNLEYVPFMRYRVAEILDKTIGEGFAQTLHDIVTDRASGGFTLGVEGTTNMEDDFVRLGTAVGHLLGAANHDAMSGKFYARFLVRHTDKSDSYLRQAYRPLTLHTDGTFVSDATDWLLMMKFSEKNAVGGESRLLHIDDWGERIAFQKHALGGVPFRYKAPGSKNIDEDIDRPIFFDSPFGLAMSFIDQFVQPKSRQEASFLHDLSASMERSSGTREVALPAGELIVLNNYFWLHGRSPFQKNVGLERELMRQRGMLAQLPL